MEEQLETIPPAELNEQEDWDEEEYEEEDDEDITAEAQEIARRLGEQLWADISMANAERNAASTPSASFLPPTSAAPEPGDSSHDIMPTSLPIPRGNFPRKEGAILATMKAILTLVENDPLAKETLGSTVMVAGTNVLCVLQRCVSHGNISKGVSGPLSQIMVTLARSETLFGNLKNSDASAIQLDKGKRKREEFDEGRHLHPHVYKRPYVPDDGLQTQVFEAVRVISQALGSSPPQSIDPTLVSSIRLQLHQIFLFAVTSSAAGGVNMHALQEISGLIQVISVLSGIQIGHSAETTPHPSRHFSPRNPYPWHSGQPPPMQTNIGTAVYPCLATGCQKIFSRLYSLRAHQRSHASHRPFRCSLCPASFARNHDLKRHFRLHDKKAWRCEGCAKVFSRRDAIKRHKNGIKNRGPRSEICLAAEVTEVQLDGGDGEDLVREERRAKLWNGIAVNEANSASMAHAQVSHQPSTAVDEGEINPIIIGGIQALVLGLHELLQAFVGNVLGTPLGRTTRIPPDPSAGQVTLASVIARAQSHNGPGSSFASPQPFSGQVPEHASDAEPPATEGSAMHALSFGENPENQPPLPSLSMYGLSDEQTHLLEIAIASAASAAQAQAEAEAALEEEEEGDYEEDDDDEVEMEEDKV